MSKIIPFNHRLREIVQQAPPQLVLFGGILAVSSSALLIRQAQTEADSLVIASWRMLLATAILLPFFLRQRGYRETAVLTRSEKGWLLLSGAALSLHFATWISSLAYTSVASSTVLVTTSPLWVALAAPLLLGERIGRSLKWGLFLAMSGGLVVSLGETVWTESGGLFMGSHVILGNGLALAGALTAAIYLIAGRKLRRKLSLLSYITLVYGTAALVLVGITAVAGHSLFGYSGSFYLLCLLMAIFPQLMGHSSYNWALGVLPTVYVTITLLSEPVGAGLLAAIFLQEIPTPLTLAGAVLILIGIGVASREFA